MSKNTPRYTRATQRTPSNATGGRKPKLSQETISKCYRLLKEGNYDITVQAILGVSQDTWYRWLREGKEIFENENHNIRRDPETLRLEADFYYAVTKARADAEATLLKRLQIASKTQWQAAAWILERRYRERWGREFTTGPIQVNVQPYVDALNASVEKEDVWTDEDAETAESIRQASEENVEPGVPGADDNTP